MSEARVQSDTLAEPVERDRPERAPRAVPGTMAQPGQYLTFFIGGEEYGIPILEVVEIVEYSSLTRVPMTPDWIRGVMNLRGQVIATVDLAVKLGLDERPVTNRTCIVIVELELAGERGVLGIMVDSVSQVLELSADEIERPPAFGTRVDADCLQGLGKTGDRFVLLLDVGRSLSAGELQSAASLSQPAASASDD